jgi:uncharacterized Tic20 family protein
LPAVAPAPPPPPPPPPPAVVAVASPSQDDRLLAAVAHLSFFAGLWLIGPAAIFLLKRKESRFVAFHALQAALVQVVFGVLFAAGLVLMMFGGFAAGLSRSEGAMIGVSIVSMALMLLAPLGVITTHCLFAYGAWLGRSWRLPFGARIADAILRADEGAAR